MIRSAADLYVHTVTVAQLTGVDGDGAGNTYSAPVALQCLIAEEVKLLRAPDGSDTVSGTQIYADPTPLLTLGARVVLPSAPHRPSGATTYVIGVSSVVVGDPAVDGVTAMCE